jgi:hypothetical protein
MSQWQELTIRVGAKFGTLSEPPTREEWIALSEHHVFLDANWQVLIGYDAVCNGAYPVGLYVADGGAAERGET